METKSSPVLNPVGQRQSPIAYAELQQISAAAQCVTAFFRGFEEMRRLHEVALHAAAQDHAAVAAKFRGVRSPEEVLAIQAELVQRDVQGAVRYWQELCEAALELQTHILGRCSPCTPNDFWLEAASAFERATDPGTALSRAR